MFLGFVVEISCNNLVALIVQYVPTSAPIGILVSVVYSLLCCLWETTHDRSLAARMGTLLLWGSRGLDLPESYTEKNGSTNV